MILNNLQEVSEHLHSLILEMSQIRNKLINPIEAKQHNAKHSFLIRLPKLIFLAKVAPFLTLKDIESLSNTCAALRKSIYGPIGFKILSFTHTPYPIAIKQVITEKGDFKIGKMPSENEENMMDYQDQKFLKRERAKFKQILMGLFQKYNIRKEEYQQNVKQMKRQKGAILRTRMSEEYFINIREELYLTNQAYKSELKQISEGFMQKLKKLDDTYDDLLRQRTKLQNQKQALVGKVREYQNQIQTIRAESDKSKEILKKIKNYLLYKEL